MPSTIHATNITWASAVRLAPLATENMGKVGRVPVLREFIPPHLSAKNRTEGAANKDDALYCKLRNQEGFCCCFFVCSFQQSCLFGVGSCWCERILPSSGHQFCLWNKEFKPLYPGRYVLGIHQHPGKTDRQWEGVFLGVVMSHDLRRLTRGPQTIQESRWSFRPVAKPAGNQPGWQQLHAAYRLVLYPYRCVVLEAWDIVSIGLGM